MDVSRIFIWILFFGSLVISSAGRGRKWRLQLDRNNSTTVDAPKTDRQSSNGTALDASETNGQSSNGTALDASKTNGQSSNGNAVSAPKAKRQAIFSTWTPWTRCSRKCKQRRTKHCLVPSKCGHKLVREEKRCFTDRCRRKKKTETFNDSNGSEDTKILFHVTDDSPYTEWTDWGPCSDTCVTHRTKECRMPEICGIKKVKESSFCYEKNSACENRFKPKKKRKKSGGPSEVPNIHPLEGLQCGTSPIASQTPDIRSKLRIIGGREAKRGSWPWQMTVLNRHREPFCGATLVSRSWVLTAAHCLRKKLIVRAGEHDLMTAEGTEQESTVEEYFVHPDYNADTVNNDIALLKLSNPFVFDNYTQPACLPSPKDVLPVQSVGQILGWGKRSSTAIYGTDHLHQAEVPIIDLKECLESYVNYPINEKMLCAGYKQGRVDSCAGDSGGPLLSQLNGKWTIFGITSFGDGCGEKGKYGIYSSVPKFVKWIKKVIGRHS